jgi:predicted cobalt transporter CbtA
MAQFDVFKNKRRGPFPLLLDVQADVLRGIGTTIVVPMVARHNAEGRPLARIHLMATIDGADYVLLFNELGATPREFLGMRVATLASRRSDWLAALDMVLTGS